MGSLDPWTGPHRATTGRVDRLLDRWRQSLGESASVRSCHLLGGGAAHPFRSQRSLPTRRSRRSMVASGSLPLEGPHRALALAVVVDRNRVEVLDVADLEGALVAREQLLLAELRLGPAVASRG